MRILLKECFELFCRNNWLRVIRKEVDKYNKLCAKGKVSEHVISELIDRYNELYPNDMIKQKFKKGERKCQSTQ